MVEEISSQHRGGSDIKRNLRWGVFVSFEAPTDYVQHCFKEYSIMTDDTGRYSALYRPFHLIGFELGISVIFAGFTGQPTGVVEDFNADVVATTKRGLEAGELLTSKVAIQSMAPWWGSPNHVATDTHPLG